MNLINKIGISYKAGYLIQGNQLERCKTSAKLNVSNTLLYMRSDGKDCDIASISKIYKGNIIFHLPPVNPDLGNLKLINELTRKLVNNNIKMVTINASNLSLDLFEWSTLEEQKKYFLNIVTSIATLASNKIVVAIDNLNSNETNSMFGSNITQITDIIVYSRRLLVKDFGFSEKDVEKYINLSLNINNVNLLDNKENLVNWLEVFSNSIKVIKISNINDIDKVNNMLDIYKDKKYNIPIFLETVSELEDIETEYKNFETVIKGKCEVTELNVLENTNTDVIKKIPNILMGLIIFITIVIVVMMFMLKLR